MLKVKMYPPLWWFKKEESGIKRVVEAYYKHLPKYGIELVEGENTPCDIVASHAGTISDADVVHTHGLYWSADFTCTKAELQTNKRVIDAVRRAKEVTVPSEWVQQVFQRDMRFSPHVVGHGIDAEDWKHELKHKKYVLWNKNRDRDVCSTSPIAPLATTFKSTQFITTFAPDVKTNNIKEIGIIPHAKMKKYIQEAGVYLSTTKETFGIGILEALAAGVPVLGFDHGGNSEIVQHGVNGYLAQPGNYDDLKRGLQYCIENRNILGENGIETVKEYTWEESCEKIAAIYKQAYQKKDPSVSVIIPSFNYGEKVHRAIDSAVDQTFPPKEIVIVDDGSSDNTKEIVENIVKTHEKRQKEDQEYNQKTKIKYIHQENSGVAIARNIGVKATTTKYVSCLDADDKIAPEFLEVCVDGLEKDRSLGIAYTGLHYIKPGGEEGKSPWPGVWDFDNQLQRRNQVPTCNVMRRVMFDRLGGYKHRYAPLGAGSEDAELWLRSGAFGWKSAQVDSRGLFIYSWLSGIVSGNPDYHEVDWLAWHPWVRDQAHPFASYATPKDNISHLVRQYDEPIISVIIPVGPGHGDVLVDALDSLEAQTFRKWEAIVVFDSPEKVEFYKEAYPYLKTIINDSGKPKGAGWARNKGVELAKSGLVIYLDADDWLRPEALDRLLFAWTETGGIIYSDYVAKGKMTAKDAKNFKERLLHFDKKKEEGTVKFRGLDYDCEKAQEQPKDIDKPYIWNLITSLLPIEYHKEIGGFDEKMESWEDWDYWLRMAKAGKCFYRVAEELVLYRFYTGTRRSRGREIGKDLTKYLKKKYKGIENMGCDCTKLAKKMADSRFKISKDGTATHRSNVDMEDENYLLIRYDHSSRGQHRVYGPKTNQFYGYHGSGAEFYVHKDDIVLNPKVFVPITKTDPIPKRKIQETVPPKLIKKQEEKTKRVGDITNIPGVSSRIAAKMNAMGIHTREDFSGVDVVDLMTIKGVGEATATKILEYAK